MAMWITKRRHWPFLCTRSTNGDDSNAFPQKKDSVINVKVEFGEGEGKVPLAHIAKRADFIAQIQRLKMDVVDIKFDNVKNKISSTIDFTKTKAEICSVVIFIGELDVSYQYRIGKKIVFELKATDTISSIEVECKLKNRDVRKKVVTSSDWESYSISLTEFGGDISEWKYLKEIKFLLRREDTSGGKIEIKI